MDENLQKAVQLLRPGECEVPAGVVETVRFFDERHVWFRLSRNQKASSCRDAATKRERLGMLGIPLSRELKSLFLRARYGHEKSQLVVAHCHGNHYFELERVKSALGAASVERLNLNDLKALGLGYGLVNPFGTWTSNADCSVVSVKSSNLHLVLQVFDEGLLEGSGAETVMTNAGEVTWGVEFRPRQLVDQMRKEVAIVVAHVVKDSAPMGFEDQSAESELLNGVGIITGNPPDAGILFWRQLNDALRKTQEMSTCDERMPQMAVKSNTGLAAAFELSEWRDNVGAILMSEIESLCAADVDVVVNPCLSLAFFDVQLREVCTRHNKEFISLPEVLRRWFVEHKVESLALLGLSQIVECGPWSSLAGVFEPARVELPSEKQQRSIEQLIRRIRQNGPQHYHLSQLKGILETLKSPHVVLATSELSMLLDIQKRKGTTGKLVIDPLRVYAKAIAERLRTARRY